MPKKCIISNCPLEDEFCSFFTFPEDSIMLDQWISKLPLFNFTNVDFKSALICEYHFNPKDVIQEPGKGNNKVLVDFAVPGYFPGCDEIEEECCRFCLKNIGGQGMPIDDLVKSYYQNLMQEELKPVALKFSCEECLNAIRSSSFIKAKIRRNQKKLFANLPASSDNFDVDYLEIKIEPDQSEDEEIQKVVDHEYEADVKKVEKKESSKSVIKLLQIEKAGKEIPSGVTKQGGGYCNICKKQYQNIYIHKRRSHPSILEEEKKLVSLARAQKRFGHTKWWKDSLENEKEKVSPKKRKIEELKTEEEVEAGNEFVLEEGEEYETEIVEEIVEEEIIEEVDEQDEDNVEYYEEEAPTKKSIHQREGYCHICQKNYRSIYQHMFRKHRAEQKMQNQKLKRKMIQSQTSADEKRETKSIVYLNDAETLEFEILEDEADFKQEFDTNFRKTFCEICQDFYTNITSHNRSKHGIVQRVDMECDFCGFVCHNRKVMSNHFKTHQKVTFLSYTCEFCNKDYLSKESYRQHVDRYHLKKGVVYCEFCGKSMANRQLYHSHVATRHTGIKDFQCPQCPMKFFMKRSMNIHIDRVHSSETAVCPECGIVFPAKENMASHFRRNHAEKRYVCDWEGCGKKFAEGYRLKFHIKTVHYNLREHECEICGKAFKKRDKVKRHILQVHTSIKFNCEIKNCKAQFPRKDNYKNHVLKRHQDIGPENVQKLLEKIDQIPLPDVEQNIVKRE